MTIERWARCGNPRLLEYVAQHVDEAELKGYLMRNLNEPRPNAPTEAETPPTDEEDDSGALWAALGILAVLLAWRWRRGKIRT